MIQLIGKYINASRLLNGDLTITLAIENEKQLDELENLENTRLTIDIDKYSEHRGLQANRYFWKLCTLIAEKLHTNKDVIHDMKIRDYGVYFDLSIFRSEIPQLMERVKGLDLVDELYEIDGDLIEARAYYGSRTYTKKEMAVLIDGVINDATDLGINVLPEEEIEALINNWEGK